MNITAILDWTNKYPGAVAVIIFLAGLAITFFAWLIRSAIKKRKKKTSISIEIIESATMCSSFDVGNNFHRTAFSLYLKVTNTGDTSVQIGEIHVGYKSTGNDDIDNWYWLKDETAMLEDFCLPLGEEKKKIIPFLKQRNFLMENQIQTYLSPGEYTNGLIYFEQDRSTGEQYPYLEPDMKVQTKVVVHDTKGNKWEKEHRVTKVKIEPIREICPTFGKTRELSEN
jgi:hypothetical protein